MEGRDQEMEVQKKFEVNILKKKKKARKNIKQARGVTNWYTQRVITSCSVSLP